MSVIKNKNTYFTKMPTSIWILGTVSMFMDISSELIHSLLPIFAVTTLGISMTFIGIMEGVAEAVALIIRMISGPLSDYLHNRKLLSMIGYGLAAFSKLLFPLANSFNFLLMARLIDRTGKGIRGAPLEALVGDIAPHDIRGRSFALRQALDTIGAVLGPLLAIAGMIIFSGNIRLVLWLAVIPAFISLLIFTIFIKEPKPKIKHDIENKIKIIDIRNMGKAYWNIMAISGVLMLARFSEAFLLLKAQVIGIHISFIPVIMILMNIVYSSTTYYAGVLSDRLNRKTVLLFGITFLFIADLFLGFADNYFLLILGVILWGMHMAFSQSLLTTMVTDTAPEKLRGTAYGIFNLICGIGILISSVMAGVLWDRFGSSVTFFVGAIFTLLAFISLLLTKYEKST